MMKRINFTPEERRIADNHRYHQMKRASEDAYVRKEEKVKNAKNFLALGISVEDVAKGTGLSVEEVKKLKISDIL